MRRDHAAEVVQRARLLAVAVVPPRVVARRRRRDREAAVAPPRIRPALGGGGRRGQRREGRGAESEGGGGGPVLAAGVAGRRAVARGAAPWALMASCAHEPHERLADKNAATIGSVVFAVTTCLHLAAMFGGAVYAGKDEDGEFADSCEGASCILYPQSCLVPRTCKALGIQLAGTHAIKSCTLGDFYRPSHLDMAMIRK